MNIKEWNESAEEQRNGICRYQHLTQKFINLIWEQCTVWQRNTICVHQSLTPKFIRSIWNQCTKYQHECICNCQLLTQKFINSVWEQSEKLQRIDICYYQHLTPKFIDSIWEQCDELQRNRICQYQHLTQKFIRSIWEQCTEYQRNKICIYQRLTSKFIKFVLEQCNYDYEQKRLLTTIHKNYPDKARRIKRAKDYAKKHNLKVKGNYLYAFRNHTNGKGMYSKINIYKPGIMYQDWHCDPRPEVENSYGFGVWPTGNTPIVVPLDKFVVEVERSGGKARVEAFKVIK